MTSILVLVFGIICQTLCFAPVYAERGQPGLIRVPVLFITDRNIQPTKAGNVDFGPHRKYIGECMHDPFMGSAYCVVANPSHKPLTDHLKSLGWAEAQRQDKLGEFKATPLTADSFDQIQKAFYDIVHKDAQLTDDRSVLVFAHGFKNAFRNGLSTAAKLAYYSEHPLILYSWPSADALNSYTTDENNIEWSQEHFNDFVSHLEQISTADPSFKVRMFAHSMGTRLVVRATPFLKEKHYLTEVGLICPDIDDGLVKHYARRYLSVNGTATIRLYMSRQDKALPLSQLLHGGYTRFGEQADAIGGFVSKIFRGENSDIQQDETEAEKSEFAERLKATSERMQTIDFTAIDRGMLGHNVPAALVCSMSFSGTPGPGLELLQEASGQRSKLSREFSKLTKLKFKDDKSELAGSVLLVARTDSPQAKHRAKLVEQVSGQ